MKKEEIREIANNINEKFPQESEISKIRRFLMKLNEIAGGC